uniref:Uncharacterized protein n=1 Tax=viral metagenome TaxID=1070528 RepID=A0A6C0JX64_9ZZZZ
MRVVFKPSPSVSHKYRVVLPSKVAFDIGSIHTEDYTDHKNTRLMRAHLIRRGAKIPREVRIETDENEIHRGMLHVNESYNEDWDDPHNKLFWDRWLLWSYTNVEHSKLWLAMRHGILFMPYDDNFTCI